MNIKLNEGTMSVKIREIVFAAMVAAIYAANSELIVFQLWSYSISYC